MDGNIFDLVLHARGHPIHKVASKSEVENESQERMIHGTASLPKICHKVWKGLLLIFLPLDRDHCNDATQAAIA